MILSDGDILNETQLKRLEIIGREKDTVTVNGLDLRLHDVYFKEKQTLWNIIFGYPTIDFEKCDNSRFVRFQEDRIVIPAKTFAVVSTHEAITFPTNVCGICSLRSSLARTGLYIPPTIVDAGYIGNLSIHLGNMSSHKIRIKAGEKFLHLVLAYTKTEVLNPYNGVYQNSSETTLAIKH